MTEYEVVLNLQNIFEMNLYKTRSKLLKIISAKE